MFFTKFSIQTYCYLSCYWCKKHIWYLAAIPLFAKPKFRFLTTLRLQDTSHVEYIQWSWILISCWQEDGNYVCSSQRRVLRTRCWYLRHVLRTGCWYLKFVLMTGCWCLRHVLLTGCWYVRYALVTGRYCISNTDGWQPADTSDMYCLQAADTSDMYCLQAPYT